MPKKIIENLSKQFPIVAIGASAGGLDAIKTFVKTIPASSGMCYVYVPHLNPAHESSLQEILSRDAAIPVEQVTDEVHLQPDKIYIIPSDKMMTAYDGRLKLEPRSTATKNIKIIDLFFSSVGVVHQSFAVGIILSGTLNDGTLGLRVIKANGGLTMVQDSSALHEQMPKSAIDSGVADFILPPEKMVGKLIEISTPFVDHSNHKVPHAGMPDDDIFKQILRILRQKKEVDFTYYKQTTIIRRIQRRMALGKFEHARDYLDFLKENKAEQENLFNDLLISVTEFFREPKTLEYLQQFIIPELTERKNGPKQIRIWVAGCATGEEAYSIAICFEEHLGELQMEKFIREKRVQIFATDVSETAVNKARTGIYSKAELKNVSAGRLERFFTKLDGSYQVNKSIRDCCIFAQHNILKDPPFSKMDIVTCRNVLIYLEPVLQKRAFTIFNYALNEKGILILGKSETTGNNSDLFSPLTQKEKIYTKKGHNVRYVNAATAGKEKSLKENERLAATGATQFIDVYKKAENYLLNEYTPPGVLVNEHFDIVQFKGATDLWLAPAPGKVSFNVIKMARHGLQFEVRNLLNQAALKNEVSKKENIAFKINDTVHYVNIDIVPIKEKDEIHFLVLFKQTNAALRFNVHAATPAYPESDLQQRNEQLEKELAQHRDDMRRITEDQETAYEELQSANEELLSGGEELQALNEELETSKEELQSSNEELVSLNHELIDKNEHLNKTRKYTEGIFATIREPLVILNHEFKVTKATGGFYKKFKLTEKQTEGKTLFELEDSAWNIEELRRYLYNISESSTFFSDVEIVQAFPATGEKILLINGRQLERIDGNKMFLLSIEDVTDSKKLLNINLKLTKLNEDLEHSNLELEQFAGIASHDLQEPLRKIRTFINIINEKSLPQNEELSTYMKKIAASAERMHSIINTLLDYSRIGDLTASFVPTDLNEVVRDILTDFELVITEKKAEIHVENLPRLSAIPLYMIQLFYNLINNALKFSKKETAPVINIFSRLMGKNETTGFADLDQSSRYVEIIVKDNGIGFDQKYAEQIFMLFNRLNARFEYPGTGIGLSICKKIVLQQGGKIYAESMVNEGTTFHILFPLK